MTNDATVTVAEGLQLLEQVQAEMLRADGMTIDELKELMERGAKDIGSAINAVRGLLKAADALVVEGENSNKVIAGLVRGNDELLNILEIASECAPEMLATAIRHFERLRASQN